MNTKNIFVSLPSKLPSTINIIIMISLSYILTSCKKELTAPQNIYPQPTEYRHSTFPLYTSNQWAYTDTSFSDTTSSPQISTSLNLSYFDSYTGESNQGKWRLVTNGFNNNYYDYFSISNDTVFIDDRIAYLPSSSIHDTVTMEGVNIADTKVYALGHKMVTPAGVFDSVYIYKVDEGLPTMLIRYFRPGIGMICFERTFNNKVIYKSVLISYDLVQ